MLKQQESEILSAYADKELTGADLVHVQECLVTSVEWREELERLQKTKNLTTALPMVSAPVDLLDFLERQADQHNKKQFDIWRLSSFFGISNMWTLAGSMAMVVFFLVSTGVYRAHENAFIPLEPLLAAHSRSYSDSPIHQNVLSAALYSSRLKTHAKN